METNAQNQISQNKDPNAAKKVYETPELTVHGTIAKITENTGPSGSDGITGFSVVFSDRAAKFDFASVAPEDILSRLVSIPVETWSYKAQGPSVRHIGPMAQDFSAAFGVGEDDKHINMVDANGVTIAAIQALYAMLQQRDQQLDLLRNELNQIKQGLKN